MRELRPKARKIQQYDPQRVNHVGLGGPIKKGAKMSDSAGVVDGAGGDDDLWFGHPRGLYICFMTEMWERFSYYGMRALLIFYLTQHFLFGDDKAFLIYGAYTALVYVTPMIGGILADRYLGARKAVTMGALLLVAGHFGMAFEGSVAQEVVNADGTTSIVRDPFFLNMFYLSLALIISGVGFLKANISTIVGSLYEQNDARRDGGFTIFYMGINLGAFAGALLAGWLGQTYGWGYGFGLAGIGMLGGLYIFLKGQPLLKGHAEPPDAEQLKAPVIAGLSQEKLIWAGTLVGVLVIWQLIQRQEIIGDLLNGFGGLAVLIVMIYSFTQCTPVERDRMLVATVLILSSIMFWALFEQSGSSLNLLADRNVDRVVLGYEIPASLFQSLNAAFIFMLAPLFNILWIKLAAAGREPSTPVKFGLGIIQLGLGFLVLVFGMSVAGDGQTALVWLMLIYLLHTTGELCLSPVGLSMVTKLSVGRVVGMMMGAWFLASGFANFVAARIAQMTSAETHGGEVLDAAGAAATYMEVFNSVGWMAIGVGVFMILISPLLRKGMHGVH